MLYEANGEASSGVGWFGATWERGHMATSAFKRKQGRRGRPARGRDGDRVRDYPTVLIRMDPSTRELLVALAETTRRSQSDMVSDSLFVYQYNYLRTYDLTAHHRVQKRLSEIKRKRNSKEGRDMSSSRPS
jgi:hypothetical protein